MRFPVVVMLGALSVSGCIGTEDEVRPPPEELGTTVSDLLWWPTSPTGHVDDGPEGVGSSADRAAMADPFVATKRWVSP